MTDIARRGNPSEIARRNVPSEDQVVELLQLAAAFDHRKFGYAEKAAWTAASQIGDWTFEEAAHAIKHHQSTSKDYLTPGHITCFVRDMRRRNRIRGGVNPETGAKMPSHAEAVQLWVDEMRAAGAGPTDEQREQASSLLAELLDEAPSPVMVLHAAVLAAKEYSSRIDWRLEKLGKDYLQKMDMPPIPVQYVTDDRFNVRYVISQPDFPAEWHIYDPTGSVAAHREDAIKHGENITRSARTPRDMPPWLVEHLRDTRKRNWQGFLVDDPDYGDGRGVPEHLREDASCYQRTAERVKRWFAEDEHRWEQERLPIVRAWYEQHPNWHRDPRALRDSAYWSDMPSRGPRVER